jgi:hypothetical protein
MKHIAITGTREVDASAADVDALYRELLDPFDSAHTSWYLGGAAGIDTDVLTYLTEHGRGRVTVAVPAALSGQPESARRAIDLASERGRLCELVQLRHPAGSGEAAWEARNRWLVDHADLVIGFPLHAHPDGSGTWQTLQYALDQGLPILIAQIGQARRLRAPATGNLTVTDPRGAETCP